MKKNKHDILKKLLNNQLIVELKVYAKETIHSLENQPELKPQHENTDDDDDAKNNTDMIYKSLINAGFPQTIIDEIKEKRKTQTTDIDFDMTLYLWKPYICDQIKSWEGFSSEIEALSFDNVTFSLSEPFFPQIKPYPTAPTLSYENDFLVLSIDACLNAQIPRIWDDNFQIECFKKVLTKSNDILNILQKYSQNIVFEPTGEEDLNLFEITGASYWANKAPEFKNMFISEKEKKALSDELKKSIYKKNKHL